MRIKIIALIIFIATIVFVYKFNSNNTIESHTNLNQIVTPQNIQNKKVDSVPKKAKPKEKNQKQKFNKLHIPDDIAQELAQQKYSSDPLLEIATLSILLGNCKPNRSLKTNHDKITEKQESLFLDFQENCGNIASNYPVLSQIEKSSEVEMMILNIAMQSKYADFIQRGIVLKHMDDEQKVDFLNDFIKLLIISKNATMISLLEMLPQNIGKVPIIDNISSELGTINPSYTKLILSQASMLFSCQYNDGITCSSTSSYMLKQCFEYESACGLDVQTWFQSHHTHAHNRDIAKIVDYFEQQL